MKKSYNLLGVLWDHRAANEYIPELVDLNRSSSSLLLQEIEDYNVEYNLFDLDTYRRKINLSELLSFEQIQKIDDIISKLADCREIYIVLDYIPKHRYNVLTEFYIKRTNQILTYIYASLPNSLVKFMYCGEEDIEAE